MNCDDKILLFVFAERLQNIITSIVQNDQVGFTRRRHIECTIRKSLTFMKIMKIMT